MKPNRSEKCSPALKASRIVRRHRKGLSSTRNVIQLPRFKSTRTRKGHEDVGAVVASAVTMVGRFLQKEMDETARKQYAKRMLESLGDKE